MPLAVLDTSVLPQHGALESPLISALLRVCAARGIEVVLPDLVVDESVNKRVEESAKAIQKVRSALADAGRFFDPSPVYLPESADIGADWRRDLEDKFTIVEVNPEDAKEALRREALRIAPAGKGVGSRDSAIWLTARRLADERGDTVYFLSVNTSDFGKGRLRSELVAEVEHGPDIRYFEGIVPLLEHVAEPFAYTLSPAGVLEISDLVIDGLLDAGYLQDSISVTDGDPMHAADEASMEACESTELIHAYRVDTSHLALVRVVARLTIDEAVLTRTAHLDCRCWLELAGDGGPVERLSIASASITTLDVEYADRL